MAKLFEELDYQLTPIGPVSLRRRRELRLGIDIVEVILGDEHLMSDLFTTSEIALAELGLAALEGQSLDIVIGGLGLGYTAKAAIDDSRVSSVIVVEFLGAVIDWHRSGMLPVGKEIVENPKCKIVEGDFFSMVSSGAGFDPHASDRKFDAVLVDIDHSPTQLLHEQSREFYRTQGLRSLSGHLKPGGVFGLWSNNPPDDSFRETLSTVFVEAWAEEVRFRNPYQDREEVQTVYLGRVGK